MTHVVLVQLQIDLWSTGIDTGIGTGTCAPRGWPVLRHAYCFDMRTATAQCFGLPSTISYLAIVSLALVFFCEWDAGSEPGGTQA